MNTWAYVYFDLDKFPPWALPKDSTTATLTNGTTPFSNVTAGI